jgi:hypothetical protein
MIAAVKTNRNLIVGGSLLILAILFGVNHFWGFFGHYGYDDMTYAGLANSVLHNKFVLSNDHATYRWVVIFLTAISYKFFGINDHSSALMPMLCTLATAWLISRCIANVWHAALSVFLFGLHTWTLYYADKIMPDIYVAFFFFASIYIIYQQRKNNKLSYRNGVALSLMLFLAILSKETIILTIPVFAYLMLTDIFQKRNLSFWAATLISLSLILILYLIFIKIETGHFLQRYYAIRLQSYFNPCSYDLLPFSQTVNRITSGLWLVFVRSGLALFLVFGLVSITGRSLRGLVRVTSAEDYFPTVFLLTVLCCNFMSTSPTHYVPMCEDPRHYLFLVPVAVIAGLDGMMRFFNAPKKFFWLIISFIILFYISYKNSYENPLYTYLPMIIIAVLALTISMVSPGKILSPAMKAMLCVGIIGVLLAQDEQSFIYARSMGYRFQKELVKKNLKGKQENILVLTNTVARNYGPYTIAYDTSHVIFRSFEDIKDRDILSGRKIYLLIDGFTLTMSGRGWEGMPHYAQDNRNYKVIDKNAGAELYEIRAEDVKTD